jgi:hypothetical protein
MTVHCKGYCLSSAAARIALIFFAVIRASALIIGERK